MIRTLIVDDEPLARERLRTLLQPEPDIQIIGECADGRQAVMAMTEQRRTWCSSTSRCRGSTAWASCRR